LEEEIPIISWPPSSGVLLVAAESEWYLLVLEDIPTPLLPLEVLQIEAQMENVERIPSLVPKVQRPLPPQLAFTASSTLITTPLPVSPVPSFTEPNHTTGPLALYNRTRSPHQPSPGHIRYNDGIMHKRENVEMERDLLTDTTGLVVILQEEAEELVLMANLVE
jgi:hypothetical protein